MNMNKKKENRNETMINMFETIQGQEEYSRKEMEMRLNQYILVVVVAISTFGVLMYQLSKKK